MMWRRRTAPLLLCLLCSTASACGGAPAVSAGTPDHPGGVITSGGESSRFKGDKPPRPYTMPDITLTATNDHDFNLATDTGYPVTLFFFGYTNCPDVCPLVMSDMAQTMLQLPDDVRSKTQLVFVTTDPARDTPSVLRSYLDHYNPDFVGLTGPMHEIVKAADSMGVPIEGKQKLANGGYDIGHGAQVIGFQGDTAPVIWTAGTPVSDMVGDIETLAAS